MRTKLLRQAITMSKYALYGIFSQCIFLSLVFAEDGIAQGKKNLNEIYIATESGESTVEELFEIIHDKTDFDFVYNNSRVEDEKKIFLKGGDKPLFKVLMEISKETNLQFKRVDNNIVVGEKTSGLNVSEVFDTSLADISIKVRGKVTDETGEGLPGASVLIKGTSIGTTTDIEGNYSINTPEDAILVVSFVGYTTQEVAIGGRSIVDVNLQVDAEQLEEVVVIGYGKIEKADVTGSISSLKAKDFNQGIISSPEQLIQGRTTGVQISSGSGEPGGSVKVRIRGTSSIRAGNGPLYVIDGFPLNGSPISPTGANAGTNDGGAGNTTAKNPLTFMNPKDIVSIDVLKDASATAIYGSRGANGVILITTRRGTDGKGKLQYSSSVSVSTITKKLDLLSADEFRSHTDSSLDFGSSTDWQDEIFRTAFSQNHNFSYGGGTEDSKYNLSFGYTDQQGVVEKSGMKRYTAAVNTDYDFLDDKLHLSSSLKIASVLDDNPQISNDAGFTGDLLSGAWRANPTRPVFNTDGTYAQPDINERNPVAILNLTSDETNTLRLLGSISAAYDITDDLSYKANLGFDNTRSDRTSALSGALNVANVAGLGRADFAEANSSSQLVEHTLNYNKEVGSGKLNILAGYSYQKFTTQAKSITLAGFASEDLNIMLNNIEAADYVTGSNRNKGKSFKNIDELQSYFGRVNYALNDKYIFTATVRADGSSKFGPNNRYGVFPSLAAAWRIGEEDFIPEGLNDLKLRVGWGVTGNQEFPGGNQVLRQRFDGSGSLVAPQFANPDLKWESTSQINVGIDYGFLQGRINGTVDFYKKNTKDILFRSTSALPAEQPFVFQNLGIEVENKGVELGINAEIVASDRIQWNSTFNISFNKNEVSNVGDRPILTGAISGQGLTGAFAQKISDGSTLASFYMNKFEGFDADGNNVFADGGSKYVGKSALPDYTLGWTNNFGYKNFSLSVFFAGQVGNYVYNNNGNALFLRGSLVNGGKNVTSDIAYNGESATNGNNVSTRWLEEASFLRLQNLTLSYDFNVNESKYFSDVSVIITGQNLFTITGYSGQDPEVDVDKSIAGVPSVGIDYSAYPRARTFTLGLNISFN